MWLLRRLGLLRDAGKCPVLPCKRCRRLGPQGLHHLDPLDEAACPSLQGDTEGRVFRSLIPYAHPHGQATLAELVKRSQAFRQ